MENVVKREECCDNGQSSATFFHFVGNKIRKSLVASRLTNLQHENIA